MNDVVHRPIQGPPSIDDRGIVERSIARTPPGRLISLNEWALVPKLQLIDAGADKVVVRRGGAVRGRASGADVELNYWIVVTFREGKVLRDQWFADRAKALEAAVLQE